MFETGVTVMDKGANVPSILLLLLLDRYCTRTHARKHTHTYIHTYIQRERERTEYERPFNRTVNYFRFDDFVCEALMDMDMYNQLLDRMRRRRRRRKRRRNRLIIGF